MKSRRKLILFGIWFLLAVFFLNACTQPMQETAVPPEMWRTYNKMLSEILTTERPVQEMMEGAQIRVEEIAP